MNEELEGVLETTGELEAELCISGGGTTDYNELNNKPQINGVELEDNKTAADLGIINDVAPVNNAAYSSAKIEALLYDMLPTDNASGSMATFSTSLVLPLVNIEVENTATKVYQRGVNLWDESWEAGDYDNQGNKRAYATRTRCKNKIPVAPGVVYRFYMETASGLAWQFYDVNGEFISQQSRAAGQGGFDITTPNNCHFLTFGTWDAYGGTYRNDISVNCPNNGTNAYYPYNPLSGEYSLDELGSIVTFEGINNIFADNGNITECKFKDGIQHYIDKQA